MATKPTKVVARRGLAFLIDTIPGFVLYWLLIDAIGVKLGEEPGDNYVMQTEIINGDVRAQLGDSVYYLSSGDFALVTAIAMAYWLGVFVLLQGLTGATIGKALVAIRTVDARGLPCGIGRAAIRWLLLIVDGFFYFFPLVGMITALASDGNRRVGDMAAGTYVVRASAVGEPVAAGAAMPPAVPDAQARWDPARNAYISWEPRQQIWLQWDPAAGRWTPLAG